MKITSIHNEKLKFIENLKEKKFREVSRLFLVEGEHLVREAITTHQLKTLITSTMPPTWVPSSVDVVEVSEKILSKLSFTETPGPFLGVCSMEDETTIQLDRSIIVLDGVQDPGNAGNIVRNGLGFGVNQFVFSTDSVDIYNDKFIRATQGAFFHGSFFRGDLAPLLKEWKTKLTIYTTLLDPNAKSITEIEANGPWILVLGNEGNGIRPEIRKIPATPIYIPIHPEIESLNVASAAAICVYELTKKR